MTCWVLQPRASKFNAFNGFHEDIMPFGGRQMEGSEWSTSGSGAVIWGLTNEGSYIFSFKLIRDGSGRVTALRREPPDVRLTSDLVHRFVNRIRGRPAHTTAHAPAVEAP